MAKGTLQIWLKLRILRWGNDPGGLNVITSILVRSGQRVGGRREGPDCIETCRDWSDALWRWRTSYKPRNMGNHRSWKKANTFFSQNLQKEPSLPTPHFQSSKLIFGLMAFRTVRYLWFKPHIFSLTYAVTKNQHDFNPDLFCFVFAGSICKVKDSQTHFHLFSL